MTFYTLHKSPRPVRLSEATRNFAYDSLEHHTYGLDTMKTLAVTLDHIQGFSQMTLLQKEASIIKEIAEKAPIRLVEGELVSGAATLGLAISHVMPATYEGAYVLPSLSHVTLDFACVLERGVEGLLLDVSEARKIYQGTQKEAFVDNCQTVLDAYVRWIERYKNAIKTHIQDEGKGNSPSCKTFEKTLQNLQNVPMKPASNFHEAVQSLWMTFAFVRLMGNWPGIGRLDVLLGKYLKQDLTNGTLTIDEAREILAHFFIKGCEWVRGGNQGSGDAQHYQNIVLGGMGDDGEDVTCEVTYLVLDILEELPIGDFPTTVRLSSRTPEKLLRRVAEVIRHGGGVVAIYNEDLILDALTSYGYPLAEAVQFANDGCWEVQIPGKTNFIYSPFDSLHILQHTTLKGYSEDVIFGSFDYLLEAYMQDLSVVVDSICRSRFETFSVMDRENNHFVWRDNTPVTVPSVFENDCIKRGLSYHEGGTVYNVFSPHIGGLADTVNSLYAIKKLVFDDQKMTFAQLMQTLKTNWEGNEVMRQYAINRYTYYGNDNPEVDAIAAHVLDGFAHMAMSHDDLSPIKFLTGVSTFGRQIEWAPHRLATPYGRRAGEVLAANASPTPGTDKEGVTAMIKSYASADLKLQITGAALDCKLLPSSVAGEEGLQALISLMRGFVNVGGYFMQPDVADPEILHDAQENPENYQTLSVRVSGWNARFVTLCKEWQDMVIAQNEGY